MTTNFLKRFTHLFARMTGMLFITIFFNFGGADAGSDWLNKGTDLLKTYGGSSGQTVFARFGQGVHQGEIQQTGQCLLGRG